MPGHLFSITRTSHFNFLTVSGLMARIYINQLLNILISSRMHKASLMAQQVENPFAMQELPEM